MAFRDERDADRYRIDALEDEVADKDEEIERLRAELAAQKKPRPRGKKKRTRAPKAAVPRVADLPEGSRMEIATHDPNSWMVGVGWLAVVGAMLGYAVVSGSYQRELLLPALIFGLPGLAFLVRSRLLLDSEARTITVVRSLLFPIRSVIPVQGETLVVEKRYHKPKDSEGYYAGHLFVGERKLARAKIGKARDMATRIAAFMGMPMSERNQSTKAVMREAQMPLMIMVGVMLVGGVIFALVTLLKP